MFNEKTKAIWLTLTPQREEYAEFTESFDYTGGRLTLKIAAESDYVAYINGKVISFCSFSGYKTEKYYDEIVIDKSLEIGRNTLKIVGRYEGVNSAVRIESGAFVIYELSNEDGVLLCSGEDTHVAMSREYLSHAPRHITGQLGLSSTMISPLASVETEATAPERAEVISVSADFKKRPVERLLTLERQRGEGLVRDDQRKIYDLSRETVGYLYLRVKCSSPCKVKVAYGEHLADGCVRYLIGGRDFSLDFICGEGENYFEQYFVRVACRYLEVFSDGADAEIVEIGLIPVMYPNKRRENRFEGIIGRIYDVSVRTLELCMHTHYEDCPWREQALYVLDSRNQMLCGYYAFEGSDFQRANLLFMSKGLRSDGMLELTYPAVNTPAIPFFSVMYPVSVWEYVRHTGDTSIISEVCDTMLGIMKNVKSRIDESGLIENFPSPYWNFYEWSHGSNGHGELGRAHVSLSKHDLILNCAYIYSAERLSELLSYVGEEFDFECDRIRENIKRVFYNEDRGLFRSTDKGEELYTELGNAFACLVGAGDEKCAKAIRDNIIHKEGNLIPATLSMLGYVYDALLSEDRGNAELVINDIKEKYGYMLDCGATSFWETINGESDFANAGSLCHGWSAMPIYYFEQLL